MDKIDKNHLVTSSHAGELDPDSSAEFSGNILACAINNKNN